MPFTFDSPYFETKAKCEAELQHVFRPPGTLGVSMDIGGRGVDAAKYTLRRTETSDVYELAVVYHVQQQVVATGYTTSWFYHCSKKRNCILA